MKTDSSGLTDTYTITYTNGLTTTFSVVNGATGPKGDKGDKGDQGDAYVLTSQDKNNIA
jgi:hypothetical protein